LDLNFGVDGAEEEEVYGSEEEQDEFNSDNDESHLNRYQSPKPTLSKKRAFEKAHELQAYFEGLGVSFEVLADDNIVFETQTYFSLTLHNGDAMFISLHMMLHRLQLLIMHFGLGLWQQTITIASPSLNLWISNPPFHLLLHL